MGAFFDGFFTEMPSWFFFIASIIILIGLSAATLWIALGTRRFADSLGKEKRLYDLQEQVHKLSNENEYNKNVSLKLLNVIDNSRLFLNTINGEDFSGYNIPLNIQRIIEGLAADVKTRAGEKHRAGFWVEDEEQLLKLIHGSSGFPDHYIGNRKLGMNDSIAGRCFRKNTIINCPDVNDDHDYEKSDNDYVSLICVPVGLLGVLTVDGKIPFDKSAESIAELYASILESMITHLTIKESHTELFAKEQIASTTEMEDDKNV